VPVERLAGHFHDTYGRAIDNARASHGFGLRVFDGSVAGLGGCPYAPGARGNVDTLRLLDLFEGLGIETGIDRQALAGCGAWILGKLGRAPGLEESPVLSP
jgi:hydroxymethylglutaryl-CoA lyase